nr:hypothetical protein BaRGS_024178 [Batillaria attramentaria]
MNSFTETLNTAAGGDPIDGATFIDEFAKWIPTQQMLTQTADMYMIFTGLNAEHDGEGSGSSCSEDLKNIMAPVFQADSNFAQPQNLFDFSSCSVESMADFLNTVTCTLPAQTTADVELTPVPDGNLVTDLDEQCRFLTQYSQGGRFKAPPRVHDIGAWRQGNGINDARRRNPLTPRIEHVLFLLLTLRCRLGFSQSESSVVRVLLVYGYGLSVTIPT